MTSSVTILMGSYNGGRFIGEQLDTIEGQSHGQWSVTVSDDGSTDNTVDVVRMYQDKWGKDKLRLRQGPGRGFCRNFLSLACDPGTRSDYYAFADQDDLWEREKLSIALSWLKSLPKDVPAIYCGASNYVDEKGKSKGISKVRKIKASFENSLIECIAGGNTMVFNEAARKLLVAVGFDREVPSHDWLTYILTIGNGGYVKYDSTPLIRYRQHSNNLVGGHTRWHSKLVRAIRLYKGQFKLWNHQHIKLLEDNKNLLNHENIKKLELIKEMHDARGIDKYKKFKQLKIARSSKIEQFGFQIAALMGML